MKIKRLSKSNADVITKKYYCGGKGSFGLNDGRRTTRRKKAVPRAAAGYARQLKTHFINTHFTPQTGYCAASYDYL